MLPLKFLGHFLCKAQFSLGFSSKYQSVDQNQTYLSLLYSLYIILTAYYCTLFLNKNQVLNSVQFLKSAFSSIINMHLCSSKNDSSGKAFPHLLIFQVPLTSHFVPQKDNLLTAVWKMEYQTLMFHASVPLPTDRTITFPGIAFSHMG